MVKPAPRTKSIGFKVSEEEYAQLDAEAQTSRRSLGEWCREVLLASVNGQEPKVATDSTGTGEVALMELVELRAILLNALFKLAKGQSLTAQEMLGLIDRADSDKLETVVAYDRAGDLRTRASVRTPAASARRESRHPCRLQRGLRCARRGSSR
jgi:hypothetical protein